MDITIPYKPAKIAKDFSKQIHSGVFSLKNSNAESVLEFLHTAYTDVQGRDPKEIDQGFIELENHLSKAVSLEENNEIFSIVCRLCDAYEKRAFIDAIQIGAYLILELQD